MVVTKHLDDVPGHQNAHGHGACITDEHLGVLAQDIVDEEGDQGACKHEGKHGIGIVVCTVHSNTEHQTEGDAEATGKAINAVDHIHGIDDAHTCKDSEGYTNLP